MLTREIMLVTKKETFACGTDQNEVYHVDTIILESDR